MSEVFVGPDRDPDRYRLLSLIGSGGEAQVWQARQPEADPVSGRYAIKVFTEPLDPDAESRWLERNQALQQVHSPALARVHAAFAGPPMHPAGAGRGAGRHRCRYLVMDLVPGPSLREWIEDHPQTSLRHRLTLLLGLAAGLDTLHAGGSGPIPIAHGDLKPDNVRLPPDGSPTLVDFGSMRLPGHRSAGPALASTGYAAPEILAAGGAAAPTPQADRFSFGVTAFSVLTGLAPPLRPDGLGPDPAAILALLQNCPSTAGRPGLHSALSRSLAADPAQRPERLLPWLTELRLGLGEQDGGTGAVTVPRSPAIRTVALAAVPGTAPAMTPEPASLLASAGSVRAARPRRRRPLVATAALAAATLAGGALFSQLGSHGSASGGPSPAPSPSAPVVVRPSTAPSTAPATAADDGNDRRGRGSGSGDESGSGGSGGPGPG
jgi:hypothetical protein